MIEKLRKVYFVIDKEHISAVLDKLFETQFVHITPYDKKLLTSLSYFKSLSSKTAYVEELHMIDFILSVFGDFGVGKKGFFQSFFPEDIAFTESDFNRIVKSFDLKNIYDQCVNLVNRHESLREEEDSLKEEIDFINSLGEFPFQYSVLNGTKDTRSLCFMLKNKDFVKFQSEEKELIEEEFFYPFASEKNITKVFLLYLSDDERKVFNALKKYNIERIQPLERVSGFREEEVARINSRFAEIGQEKRIIKARIGDYYKYRNDLIALGDFYNSLKFRDSTLENFLEGKEVCLVKGFFKAEDADKLDHFSNDEHCFVIEDNPDINDVIPVSLKNFPLFQPFEFLVRLFGLPSYSGIDPTPIVAILFSVFFGIALGDAFYGSILTIFGFYFLRKYSRNVGARHFFSIVAYGGIMSIIAGLLTGSLAGSFFPLYFPDSAITYFLSSIAIIDPISPTGSLTFLIFSIGVGVVVQFLGIALNVVLKVRSKDYFNAIFNGVGWLLFLPGLIMLLLISTFPFLRNISYTFIGIGLAMVFVGGWASTRRAFFKPVAAFVNIYGIRSSYGVTSFLGDALSYSRLFALGLTSSILASSFNMMAQVIGGMLGSFGIVPLILVLLVTHALGLFINVLGAFIHSMRLNFLEFLGRFYDIGGYEFKPLGLNLKNIRIEREVKNNGK